MEFAMIVRIIHVNRIIVTILMQLRRVELLQLGAIQGFIFKTVVVLSVIPTVSVVTAHIV